MCRYLFEVFKDHPKPADLRKNGSSVIYFKLWESYLIEVINLLVYDVREIFRPATFDLTKFKFKKMKTQLSPKHGLNEAKSNQIHFSIRKLRGSSASVDESNLFENVLNLAVQSYEDISDHCRWFSADVSVIFSDCSSRKTRGQAQASSEQADAQSMPQMSKQILPINCHAWTCLSIVTLECTSPAKRFPPKTVDEEKFLSTQPLNFILTKN